MFKNEIGGHRWQRIPPTERHDRVHTSTITVSVIKFEQEKLIDIDQNDVEETFMRGSGKGGQHRNKTSTACRLTHKPTGIQVRVESERSQSQNRINAWNELKRKLNEIQKKSSLKQISTEIKTQVGSGMRGDKRRTYREKDDSVLDHITNMKASYTRILKGELELLWPNT